MSFEPSAQQIAAFQSRPAAQPVVLFYEFDVADTRAADVLLSGLRALAQRHDGALRWAAIQQQLLIGRMPLYGYCCRVHFRSRTDALRHVQDAAHGRLLGNASQVKLSVVSEEPSKVRPMIWLMSALLPHWPFDNSTEEGPEPGTGTSIMPTESDVETMLAHPQQHSPVVMVNWLRFRPQAVYESQPAVSLSGQDAYYRYGKVAFAAIHHLKGKALFVSRYQQVLIGNQGDPGLGLWHDFVLARYPGRATFKHMASLRRYRRALSHRAAGLADYGQGLVVSESYRLPSVDGE